MDTAVTELPMMGRVLAPSPGVINGWAGDQKDDDVPERLLLRPVMMMMMMMRSLVRRDGMRKSFA